MGGRCWRLPESARPPGGDQRVKTSLGDEHPLNSSILPLQPTSSSTSTPSSSPRGRKRSSSSRRWTQSTLPGSEPAAHAVDLVLSSSRLPYSRTTTHPRECSDQEEDSLYLVVAFGSILQPHSPFLSVLRQSAATPLSTATHQPRLFHLQLLVWTLLHLLGLERSSPNLPPSLQISLISTSTVHHRSRPNPSLSSPHRPLSHLRTLLVDFHHVFELPPLPSTIVLSTTSLLQQQRLPFATNRLSTSRPNASETRLGMQGLRSRGKLPTLQGHGRIRLVRGCRSRMSFRDG